MREPRKLIVKALQGGVGIREVDRILTDAVSPFKVQSLENARHILTASGKHTGYLLV